MQELTFSQYKMDVLNTITHNMFEDKQHYSYFNELLINVLLSVDGENHIRYRKNSKNIGFTKKDNEHVNVLKREFSEIVDKIEERN